MPCLAINRQNSELQLPGSPHPIKPPFLPIPFSPHYDDYDKTDRGNLSTPGGSTPSIRSSPGSHRARRIDNPLFDLHLRVIECGGPGLTNVTAIVGSSGGVPTEGVPTEGVPTEGVPTEGQAGLHVWVIPAWFPMAASGFNPGMPDVVSLPEGKERDRSFFYVWC
jgi:hypothetical protein